MLKVLMCASEVAPIIKIGGLGDVVGSLPKSLELLGVDVDVVVPFFSNAKVQDRLLYKSRDLFVNYQKTTHKVEIWITTLPNSNVDVYLLKSDLFFSKDVKAAFSGVEEETRMFAFFDKCICELVKEKFNTYDLVHCNDWHTGLVPHLLFDELQHSRPATIMTIHNISYQGVGKPSLIEETGLKLERHKSLEWDISDGDMNLLMQGIMSADFINTVSPTYAKELVESSDSSKIIQVLKSRKDRFLGILNGINYEYFPRVFGIEDWKEGKTLSKEELKSILGFEQEKAKPVFSMISRLDPNQKGLDILYETIHDIVCFGGIFILLGSGDKEWEKKFQDLSNKINEEYKSKKFIFVNSFDPELAIKIYSASDFFLIPSKFEPCGLTQMIAMWYGAIPVAHAVGGLRDTIKHGVTGFLFDDYSSYALLNCIKKCFTIYGGLVYFDMVEQCMKQDFSFDRSARLYKELYEKAVQVRKDAYESFYI